MTGLAGLPLVHRIAGRKVVVIGAGPVADARRRLVERAGGACVSEPEAHHAALAFVALDDAHAARATALRLRGRGLLVNVADRPELCDFIVPALVERGPVVLAVTTGGSSAGLAKHLRLRLEALLPEALGQLAERLHAARAVLRGRFPDAGTRRHALDAALGEGGVLDPLTDLPAGAVDAWLKSATAPEPQVVELIVDSPDPDDLTLRGARLLGRADIVAHEPGVAPAILARVRADAERCPIAPGEYPRSGPGLTVVLRLR